MCGPKPKTVAAPAAPPAAPPPPAATATGFASAGNTTSQTSTNTRNSARGIDSLRVGLNVPDGQVAGRGVYIP